jgi:hypothetical protein
LPDYRFRSLGAEPETGTIGGYRSPSEDHLPFFSDYLFKSPFTGVTGFRFCWKKNDTGAIKTGIGQGKAQPCTEIAKKTIRKL